MKGTVNTGVLDCITSAASGLDLKGKFADHVPFILANTAAERSKLQTSSAMSHVGDGLGASDRWSWQLRLPAAEDETGAEPLTLVSDFGRRMYSRSGRLALQDTRADKDPPVNRE